MTLSYTLPSYELHTLLVPNRQAVQRAALAIRKTEAHPSFYDGASRSGEAAAAQRWTGLGTPLSNVVIQHSSNIEQ